MWYCPSASVWYYWAGSQDCYLPVRYLTVVEPTQTEPDDGSAQPPENQEVPEAPSSELSDIPEPTT